MAVRTRRSSRAARGRHDAVDAMRDASGAAPPSARRAGAFAAAPRRRRGVEGSVSKKRRPSAAASRRRGAAAASGAPASPACRASAPSPAALSDPAGTSRWTSSCNSQILTSEAFRSCSTRSTSCILSCTNSSFFFCTVARRSHGLRSCSASRSKRVMRFWYWDTAFVASRSEAANDAMHASFVESPCSSTRGRFCACSRCLSDSCSLIQVALRLRLGSEAGRSQLRRQVEGILIFRVVRR